MYWNRTLMQWTMNFVLSTRVEQHNRNTQKSNKPFAKQFASNRKTCEIIALKQRKTDIRASTSHLSNANFWNLSVLTILTDMCRCCAWPASGNSDSCSSWAVRHNLCNFRHSVKQCGTFVPKLSLASQWKGDTCRFCACARYIPHIYPPWSVSRL